MPKHKYDGGECEKTISLTNSNIKTYVLFVQNIDFFPNTTNSYMLCNLDLFPIGTIVAIVISTTQAWM